MAVEKPPPRPPQHRARSSARTQSNDTSDANFRRTSDAIRDRRGKKLSSVRSSDDATAAFVRRILCAHQLHPGTSGDVKGASTPQQLEDLLPPLTSSNEIDLQLYALISIVIKDFVQVWYSKITPDHEFVDEIIQIIAHCTRGLEQRLRRVDLESLLLDEIPAIFAAHCNGRHLLSEYWFRARDADGFQHIEQRTTQIICYPWDQVPRRLTTLCNRTQHCRQCPGTTTQPRSWSKQQMRRPGASFLFRAY